MLQETPEATAAVAALAGGQSLPAASTSFSTSFCFQRKDPAVPPQGPSGVFSAPRTAGRRTPGSRAERRPRSVPPVPPDPQGARARGGPVRRFAGGGFRAGQQPVQRNAGEGADFENNVGFGQIFAPLIKAQSALADLEPGGEFFL